MNRILSILLSLILAHASTVCLHGTIMVTTVGGNNQHQTDLLNMLTAATGAAVTINNQGKMEIANGGNGCAGILRNAINAAQAITLNVGRNLDGVAIGAFNAGGNGVSTGTQDLDLDDLSQFGNDNSSGNHTQGALLMHEIWEAIISLRDSIGYADAHKKAIEECENGYYAAMAQTPSVRVCGPETVRNHGDGTANVYVHFKKGNGTEGWSCNPVRTGGGKIQVTGAPTFTPGANPPQQFFEGILVPGGLEGLGANPGPLQGFGCTNPIPSLSEWGVIILGLLVLTIGTVFILRRRTPALATTS